MAIVSEKRYDNRELGISPGYDNEGYIAGWDWDTLRRGCLRPLPDMNAYPEERFGSSHPGGINVVYADGSTRFFSYDVNMKAFAQAWHRADGDSKDF